MRVNLPAFEGPLDLLLYLIKKDELDIYDIPIARITEEYLGYLELMNELNLDIAGEFLLMAATLTTIKSRMLLPKEEGGEGGDEEVEDPRSALVERLLEYQRYKEAAAELSGRAVLNRDVFERGQPALNLPEEEGPRLPEVSLFELLDALQAVMGQARARGFVHQVMTERFSVVDRIHWLHDRIHSERVISFRALFLSCQSRMEMILTFLALLEMVKANILKLEAVRAAAAGAGEESGVAGDGEAGSAGRGEEEAQAEGGDAAGRKGRRRRRAAGEGEDGALERYEEPPVIDWVIAERDPGGELVIDLTGID